MMHSAQQDSMTAAFERDGFVMTPRLLPRDLIDRASEHMDAVVAGKYEVAPPPYGNAYGPGDEQKLKKIDDAHISDRTLHELVSDPAIGQWAAQVTGAKLVQVWATQLLIKPRGDSPLSNVGWHQDQEYWRTWWEGEVFTAWVAVSDVTPDAGPMRFVRASHTWGLLNAGDFFSGNLDALKQQVLERHAGPWEEVPAVLPPGGASLHHRFTVHGSGPNFAALPRKSFAIHLRTENSRPAPGSTHPYTDVSDPWRSPVIYRAATA